MQFSVPGRQESTSVHGVAGTTSSFGKRSLNTYLIPRKRLPLDIVVVQVPDEQRLRSEGVPAIALGTDDGFCRALLLEGARLHVHVCVGDYVHERRLAHVGVALHKTALCTAPGAFAALSAPVRIKVLVAGLIDGSRPRCCRTSGEAKPQMLSPGTGIMTTFCIVYY